MTAKSKALAVVEDPKSPGYKAGRLAAIRIERREHRQGVQLRWNKRWALQLLEDELSRPNPQTPNVVDTILHLSRWAPISDLVETVHNRYGLLNLTNYLFRIIQLKEMPYDDYLQTPEWKSLSRKAKAHYDGQCALDARHTAEDAHHRTYERRGREKTTDLIPLCHDCHSKYHGKSPR